jgi:hypothetical protein
MLGRQALAVPAARMVMLTSGVDTALARQDPSVGTARHGAGAAGAGAGEDGCSCVWPCLCVLAQSVPAAAAGDSCKQSVGEGAAKRVSGSVCVCVCGCVWLCVAVCGCVWLCVAVCAALHHLQWCSQIVARSSWHGMRAVCKHMLMPALHRHAGTRGCCAALQRPSARHFVLPCLLDRGASRRWWHPERLMTRPGANPYVPGRLAGCA